MTGRKRPFLRSLSDGLVFLALLAMVLLALRHSGLLRSETGSFAAIDGDSLRKNGGGYRLNGIDAPELHQMCRDAGHRDYPCGRKAKAALHDLVAGEDLSCSTIDTDRYGRAVVICTAGSEDINAAMVRQGWAIAYRAHSMAYVSEEAEAHGARRGVWQGEFEAPAAWRKSHRKELLQGAMAPGEDLPDEEIGE